LEKLPKQDSWEWWRAIRSSCEENTRLGVILGYIKLYFYCLWCFKREFSSELSGDLPPQNELDRWFAEPVKALLLPTSLFLMNKLGFPVLSKAHQKCINQFFKVNQHRKIIVFYSNYKNKRMKIFFHTFIMDSLL
jgi:protein arginine N-methyltransferase 5